MIISLIAAMSRNRVIGVENRLPWHIPEDLKYFREKTKGRIIVMGRKTFESVGSKPLPGRLNVVVSRSLGGASGASLNGGKGLVSGGQAAPVAKGESGVIGSPSENLRFFSDFPSAMEFCRSQTSRWGEEVFICGGGEIYRQAMGFADRLYVTIIDREVEGDAYFPEWSARDFRETSRLERQEPERFAFVVFDRLK